MNEERFDLVKGSLTRRSRAASPEDRQEPTQQEVDELFVERITPETDLPPMQPLFEMFDVPCFYRGELVADCGKAKSGKTFFLSIIQARSLTPGPSPAGEGFFIYQRADRCFWIVKHSGAPSVAFRNRSCRTLYSLLDRPESIFVSCSRSTLPSACPDRRR